MSENVALEMNKLQLILSRLYTKWVLFRRKFIPYLVFYGEELDVGITWKENKLRQNSTIGDAMKQLDSGHLSKIENMLSEIGIGFDKGIGCGGRDWEWDWSLSGPVSVRFRRVCKTKEKRS